MVILDFFYSGCRRRRRRRISEKALPALAAVVWSFYLVNYSWTFYHVVPTVNIYYFRRCRLVIYSLLQIDPIISVLSSLNLESLIVIIFIHISFSFFPRSMLFCYFDYLPWKITVSINVLFFFLNLFTAC